MTEVSLHQEEIRALVAHWARVAADSYTEPKTDCVPRSDARFRLALEKIRSLSARLNESALNVANTQYQQGLNNLQGGMQVGQIYKQEA